MMDVYLERKSAKLNGLGRELIRIPSVDIPGPGLSKKHIGEFWIEKYSVTFEDYSVFVRRTGYAPPTINLTSTRDRADEKLLWNSDLTFDDNLAKKPVVFVSWYDALAYAEWCGMTLPTVAEWSVAAFGWPPKRFPWGNSRWSRIRSNNASMRDAWLDRDLTDVDSYPRGRSPYGCMDMWGNTVEWCLNTLEDMFDSETRFDLNHIQRFHNEPIGGRRCGEPSDRIVAGNPRNRNGCSCEHFGIQPATRKSNFIGSRCLWKPRVRGNG